MKIKQLISKNRVPMNGTLNFTKTSKQTKPSRNYNPIDIHEMRGGEIWGFMNLRRKQYNC